MNMNLKLFLFNSIYFKGPNVCRILLGVVEYLNNDSGHFWCILVKNGRIEKCWAEKAFCEYGIEMEIMNRISLLT